MRQGKASCRVNQTGEVYHLILFHSTCWLSLFPFTKMPQSLTNVIANKILQKVEFAMISHIRAIMVLFPIVK